MAVTDIAAGHLTEAGINVLISRIAASPLPEAIRGDVIGVVHAAKPDLIGLSKDVVVAAIKAIQDGNVAGAQDLIIKVATAERMMDMLMARAEARTSRARIKGKASKVLGGIIAALSALAVKAVYAVVLTWLEGGDG